MSASQLITAVYRRRPLWDPSDVHHHNRLLVANLWKDVGQELGLNVMLAKSKWRGLRDYYRQQVKRNMDQPEGQQGSGWAHFDQMSFLEPTIVPRQGRTPATSRLFKEEPTTPPETVLDISEALQQKWSPLPEWTSSRDNDIYKYTDSEVSECEDEDLLFFRSLIPDLKGLSRPKKTYIRLKIQELIYTEIYGGCKSPTKKQCDDEEARDDDEQIVTYQDKEMKQSEEENGNLESF